MQWSVVIRPEERRFTIGIHDTKELDNFRQNDNNGLDWFMIQPRESECGQPKKRSPKPGYN